MNTEKENLNELNANFFLILNDIVSILPKYKTHPDIKAYSNKYITDMANFQELYNKFNLLKKSMEKKINEINKNVEQANNQINKLEKKNRLLKTKLSSLKNSNDAGEGMLVDTKLLHNQQYIGNWIIFVVLITSGVIYYKKS
jgi:peptidoglycan hydrolase CwlO-like protein